MLPASFAPRPKHALRESATSCLLRGAHTACRTLALAVAAAWSANAAAQAVPDAGRLLEETRPGSRPTLPPATLPRLIEAPVRPTINMPEGVSVAVSGFRITGASTYPLEVLAERVKPWVGQKLDINGLNEAAGAITRFYQSAGHLLTYAYLPAQRVADGVIELAVLEGRLEGVQVVTAQDVRLRDDVIQAHVDGLAAQPPLLQADVERKLLLLNDIPGVTARAAFTPGSTTGGADMVVSVAEDEPLEFRAELNNHGSVSTGQYRAGITLQLRDLFGWGDTTIARALVSNKGGLVSGSLGTSLPVGGDGYKIGINLSRLSYQLSGNFSALGAVGSADSVSVDASWPLLRTADANFNVKGGLETKRLSDDIQLIASSNPRRNTLLEVTASGDRRSSWAGLGAVMAGSLALSQGQVNFQNPDRQAQDAAGLNTQQPYSKLVGQFVGQQSLGGPFSVLLRAAGQHSSGNLDSSEKFGLAGPNAVRAYAPGEATVDQGTLVALEARYALDYLGGSLQLGLFHDRAQGRISRAPLVDTNNNPKLSGSGLAVQWSGGDIALSASLAWRGPRQPTAEGGDPSPRLYLQLSLTP